MRYQDKIKIQRRRRRKFFWLLVAASVCALLYQEQVAVLYVISTLAICALMIVVVFWNLEIRDAEMQAASIRESAAEISTNSRELSRRERRVG